MILFRPNGTALMDIDVDDESYHYAEIMGRDDVTLYFSLAEFVDIPVGTYLEYMLVRYTLYSVDKMVMHHRRDYEYTITFQSEAAELENFIFSNPNDGRFKFPLTARPQEHLQMLVDCLNQKSSKRWTVGGSITGPEKPISYDSMTCNDALKQMANTFETEYRVTGTAIYLGKVEFFSEPSQQVPVSYGKHNGMRPGVEKTVDENEKAIGKVYVQGGERNIDFSQYGSATLLLPKNTHIWYDGVTFYTIDTIGAKHFVTSGDGRFVSLYGTDIVAEGALDLSDIYPSYEHTVTGVEEVDAENHFWDINADNLWNGSSGINYGDVLIENGADMTVIFQSGMLSGREFGVRWQSRTVEGTTTSRFEIVPSEQDGFTMPDRASGFYPKVNDTFRVFNIYLPVDYITAAEQEMLHEAVKYLWERCEPKYSIKGEIDPIWSASRWLEIGGHFKPGAYFLFSDPTWEHDGVSMRIVNVKTYINKPHKPIVEMSNSVTGQGVSTALKKIEADAAVLPESARKSSIAFTKRSFRDAKETMEAIAEAMLEGFSEQISPIAVQTMQMIAGSEALQFRFYEERACINPITNPFVYNPQTKKLTCQACVLQHMTLGIDDIKPSSARSLDEYLRWNITAYESPVFDEPDKLYYIYAKCDKLNDGEDHLTGVIVPRETAIEMNPGDGYYYFLCGILNSEREDSRSFAPLYGFTEILPGQITTDVIRSANGQSYLDLVGNVFNLGEKLMYNVNNSGQLILNGTFVQTGQSGSFVPISAWCGEYSATRTYKSGDEVWYNNGGTISSYIYINTLPTSGHLPTETAYWEPSSVGGQGAAGQGVFKSLVFVRSESMPLMPTGGSYLSPVPDGWSDGVPAGTEILWMSTRIFTSDGESPQEASWTLPQRVTSGDEVQYMWSSNSSQPQPPGSDSGSSLAWTASTQQSWIHLGAASGTGAATLTYTVDSNTSTSGTSARTGYITISYSGGSKTFTITQAGSSAATGSISPTSVSKFAAAGGSQSFSITDDSSAGWTLTKTGLDWVTLSSSGGTGNATVNATIYANSGTSERSGTLVFTCGSTTTSITISQAAASSTTGVTASVSPTSVSASGGSVNLTINDPDNHGWVYGYDFMPWGQYVASAPVKISGSGTVETSSANGASGTGSVVLQLTFTAGAYTLSSGYVKDNTTDHYNYLDNITRS